MYLISKYTQIIIIKDDFLKININFINKNIFLVVNKKWRNNNKRKIMPK